MTAYTSIYNALTDTTSDFQKQVAVAIKKAAADIFDESPTTPNHDRRIEWARNVTFIDRGPVIWKEKMLWRIMENATVRSAIVAGNPLTDAQVQAAVDAIVTEFAIG